MMGDGADDLREREEWMLLESMRGTMTHTKETTNRWVDERFRIAEPNEFPWRCDNPSDGGPTLTILSEDGYGILSTPIINAGSVQAFERILECSNAMAGVKDPQAFIDAARELYSELSNIANADLRNFDGYAEFHAWATNRARHTMTRFEAVGGKSG